MSPWRKAIWPLRQTTWCASVNRNQGDHRSNVIALVFIQGNFPGRGKPSHYYTLTGFILSYIVVAGLAPARNSFSYPGLKAPNLYGTITISITSFKVEE